MNYKKKMKIEMIAYSLLSFFCFCCLGGAVGLFAGKILKSGQGEISGLMYFALALAAFAVIFISYGINICLHETGHMIFGLLSGYRFISLRFGKLMLIKEKDKLRFCRYDLPGTGGQCIMAVPDASIEEMPVVLYNLGGLIMNLLTFLAGGALYLGLKDSHPVAGMIGLIFAMTSLVILITNGIPFTQVGTDGANAIILRRDKNAKIAFRNQMEIIRLLAADYSIQEMPEELFSFDRSMPMTDPLVTSQAVNNFNYLFARKEYAQAKEAALFILDKALSINQLHEKILHGELMFIAAVIDKDMEAAKEQFKAHKKDLNSLAGIISIQRALYAYYTLVEPDGKKAGKYAAMFEKSVKNYPYPKDAAIEQEQFDLVAKCMQQAVLSPEQEKTEEQREQAEGIE